jgi:hypothetical protein
MTIPNIWIACAQCNAPQYRDESLGVEISPELAKETIVCTKHSPTARYCWGEEAQGVYPKNVFSPEQAELYAEQLTEMERTHDLEALAAYASNGHDFVVNLTWEDLQTFDDIYCGAWDSFDAYVDSLTDELQVGWPEAAVVYFDWEKYKRDLLIEHWTDRDSLGMTLVFSQ